MKEDEELLALYNDVPSIEEHNLKKSPWLLRFELDNEKMHFKDLTMKNINDKISETFGN